MRFSLGGALIVLLLIAAMLAGFLAPYNPSAQDVALRLMAPDGAHPFGTDELGRDIFSRVLLGGRTTLPAAMAVVLLSGFVGTLLGTIAGYAGRLCDELIMRCAELISAFPVIVLGIAVSAALGASIRNAIIALSIAWWPSYARVSRSVAIEEKQQEYVEASYVLGASPYRVLRYHIFPACLRYGIVMATAEFGSAVLALASLSYLGLGSDPSTPEWGRMAASSLDVFDAWWTWLFPSLAIGSVAISVNFLGDKVRDQMDVRSRLT